MKRPKDKRVIYLNFGMGRDLETVDECRACDFASDKDWRWESDRLRREYITAGMVPIKRSQRACGNWKD